MRAHVYGVLGKKTDQHHRDYASIMWNTDSEVLMKQHQAGNLLDANSLRDSRFSAIVKEGVHRSLATEAIVEGEMSVWVKTDEF